MYTRDDIVFEVKRWWMLFVVLAAFAVLLIFLFQYRHDIENPTEFVSTSATITSFEP